MGVGVGDLEEARSSNRELREQLVEREQLIQSSRAEFEKELRESRSEGFEEGKADALEAQKLEMEEMRKEVESLNSEFNDYRESFRASLNEKWKDRVWDELILSDGSRLTEVKFRSVDAGGLRVIHSRGARLIACQDVPEPLLGECGFHEADAQAHGERYKAVMAAQAQRVRERHARVRSNADQHRLEQATERIQDLRAELGLVNRQIDELRVRQEQLIDQARQVRSYESRQERPNYVQAVRMEQQAVNVDAIINSKLERARYLETQID